MIEPRSVLLLCLAAVAVASCDSPTGPEPVRFQGCAVTATHDVGTEVDGALDGDSCVLVYRARQEDNPVDYYHVVIGATGGVDFEVESTDFRAGLILWEMDTTIVRGEVVVAEGGTMAGLTRTLEPGEYVVGVFALDPDDGGDYQLTSH